MIYVLAAILVVATVAVFAYLVRRSGPASPRTREEQAQERLRMDDHAGGGGALGGM